MGNNKNRIAPNECSLGRWIATAAAGLIIGSVLSLPLSVVIAQESTAPVPGSFLGVPLVSVWNLLTFAFMFCGMVLALKWIAKTSLKDFILGTGGSVNKKECLTMVGLQALGVFLSFLVTFANVSVRGVEPGTFAVLVVIMLLLTWMQTTWEELVFRGVFLRWACGNKVGFTKKAFVGLVLSSLAFGVMHLGNPEISSMDGGELLLGFFCYVVPGIVFYLADMQFGSLLPGIMLHWANNFLLFTVISAEVSAVAVPTLLVDKSEMTGILLLVSTFVAYVPALAYTIWHYLKRRKAAAAQNA